VKAHFLVNVLRDCRVKEREILRARVVKGVAAHRLVFLVGHVFFEKLLGRGAGPAWLSAMVRRGRWADGSVLSKQGKLGQGAVVVLTHKLSSSLDAALKEALGFFVGDTNIEFGALVKSGLEINVVLDDSFANVFEKKLASETVRPAGRMWLLLWRHGGCGVPTS